jgi:hypothetical protein
VQVIPASGTFNTVMHYHHGMGGYIDRDLPRAARNPSLRLMHMCS